jgi:hypothetical protein
MDHRPGLLLARSRLGPRLPLLALLISLVLAPALMGVASSAAHAGQDSLEQSREQRRQFPFQADCGGNTQEMVACLWERRNQGDGTLAKLLGRQEILEQWRASRRQVCRQAAEKARGGSIHPIVWLSCENGLNQELLRQLRRPLLKSADL